MTFFVRFVNFQHVMYLAVAALEKNWKVVLACAKKSDIVYISVLLLSYRDPIIVSVIMFLFKIQASHFFFQILHRVSSYIFHVVIIKLNVFCTNV